MNISIEVLTDIINKWDPVGLLSIGAPEDEYKMEIKEIAQKSSSCTEEIELAKLIYKVFDERMCVKLNQLSCLKQAFYITEQANT